MHFYSSFICAENTIYNIKCIEYSRAIKMKGADVNWSAYIDFNKENNKEDPKFKVGVYLRISKYKNIFAEGFTLNWSD